MNTVTTQALSFAIRGGAAPDADLPPDTAIALDDGLIRIGGNAAGRPRVTVDAAGLLLLPGIVDLHGDAFERQLQPRAQVVFDTGLALADTDRQLVANGITTACHGMTYSWEGGLRGRDAALALLQRLEAGRARFAADHRIHLRFENHHAGGLADALRWIAEGRIDFVAFNDHLPSIAAKAGKPEKLAAYAERARCDGAEFLRRLEAAAATAADVPATVAAIAAACRERGIPMASHDDETAAQRLGYQALGARISEFPRTAAALSAAIALDNRVVLGAPNVLLGGSHCGALGAAEVVRAGRCHILASDYYYPSLLQAPFRLAHLGDCSLAQAWALVSAQPAQALRLGDRGRIADGMRADVLLVEAQPDGGARLVATFAAGRLVYCAEPQRLAGDRAWRMAA
ncbi:MAG: alpha-D-ribose 1-methylphosphonate 5-triphosphate diphosphatase [Burkholderiaceae bacterium]